MDEIAKSAIDTTSLLTILGLVAAVWAITPQKSQLNFRLRVSLIDWAVIIGVVLLVHYLVFEEVFRALSRLYLKVDHVIRAETVNFTEELSKARPLAH